MGRNKHRLSVSQYEDKAEYLRQYRKANPEATRGYAQRYSEKVRENAWLRRYNITRDDYDRMLREQSGGCAICGSKSPGRKGHTYFHVDHCHKTNGIRGLLCDLYNRGLGMFKDNKETLNNAYEYLVKYTCNNHAGKVQRICSKDTSSKLD